MIKILITGFSGFVARHFINRLKQEQNNYSVLGIDINTPDYSLDCSKNISLTFIQCNLLRKNELEKIIIDFSPDYILHLAAFSSVGFSWQAPDLCIKNNTEIFLNLMEILRNMKYKGKVLSVGSSEEYGNYPESKLPLKEEYALHPVSPYAVARVAQEHLSKVYADGFGLDIVMTRSFNHVGPWQKEKFVIPSFVKQLVEIKKGVRPEKRLVTGNIDIIRDFLDVRDVVDAYFKLLKSGKRGGVYNICSGKGQTLREIISKICNILGLNIEIVQDEQLIRPNDNKKIIGCNDKIKNEVGWQPHYSINESLKDIINYWNEIL